MSVGVCARAKMFTELEEKREGKREHAPVKVLKRNVGNTYSIFYEGGTGRREKAAVLWKCTDAVNSGKNHYVLLMAVIKSKPTVQRGIKRDRQAGKGFKA